jgi:hypothetical protein
MTKSPSSSGSPTPTRQITIETLNIVLTDATVMAVTRMDGHYQLVVSRPDDDGVILRTLPCGLRTLDMLLDSTLLHSLARDVLSFLSTCRTFIDTGLQDG